VVRQAFVDADNVVGLADDFRARFGDPDFLSLDIDGNDLEVMRSLLRKLSPKAFCIEYNSKFPPPVEVSIAYDPAHTWGRDDYHGASLQAYVNAFTDYRLVCCNVTGVNAFFVRKDIQGFSFYSTADLYQPMRKFLMPWVVSHAPSHKFLKQALAKGQ
jgi:hypothetical protein